MVTITLLILLTLLTPTLSCDWLTEYRDLRNTSMVLVEIMGGDFTDEESPVSFPHKLYELMETEQEESQLLFIRDSLRNIYALYQQNNFSCTSWNHVNAINFLNSIHRQIEELNCCVSQQKQTVHKQMKNYYRRLKNFILKSTGFSAAGWELLRKETKHHLDRLDLLGNLVTASVSSRRINN